MEKLRPFEFNNGAPYSAVPQPIILNSNDSFYGAALGEGEPISNYFEIQRDFKEKGRSAFLEELDYKFKHEQDVTKKFQIESLVQDQDISRAEKLVGLKRYVNYHEVPVSFREKYAESAVVTSITNDPLPVSNIEIANKITAITNNEVDATLQEFARKESKKPEEFGFFERAWQAIYSGFENLTDVKEGLEMAMSDLSEQERIMYRIKAEAVAEEINNVPLLTAADIKRIAKEKGLLPLVHLIPSFIFESIANSAPQMAIPLLTAIAVAARSGPYGWLTGPAAGIIAYGVQQFGNFVNTQALVKEFAKDMDYGKAGKNAIISAPLGYAADRFVTMIKISPKKPFKDKISKEVTKRNKLSKLTKKDKLALGIGVIAKPALKHGVRGFMAEGPTEMFEAFLEREQAGLSTDDDEAWDAYWNAGWAGGAAGLGLGTGFGARAKYKQIRDFNNNINKINKKVELTDKINASPKIQIKHDSPVALSLAADTKIGNALIVASLTDPTGQTGDIVYNNVNNPELTVQTMLFYLNNSQDKFFNTDVLGYATDTSVLHAYDVLRDLNLQQRYFPEGDRASAERYQEVSDVVATLNQTDVNMIPARTFSYMDPTPTGIHTYLTFRRNSTEDFKSLEEAKVAYDSLKKSIIKNFGKDSLADLSIVEIDNNDTGKQRTINETNIDAILKNEGVDATNIESLAQGMAALEAVLATETKKLSKEKNLRTLLNKLGINKDNILDVTGESSLRKRGYGAAFKDGARDLMHHIENGSLDAYLPINMRLNDTYSETEAFDGVPAYNYISDIIRSDPNATQDVKPYDAQQEVDILSTQLEETQEQVTEVNPIKGDFRVVWNRNETLYDAYVGGQSMKATFSDRYPQTEGNLNIKSHVYSFLFESKVKLNAQGVLEAKPTAKDSISPYMAFDNATMYSMFTQDLAKEAFFKTSFERLNQVVKEDLTLNQQLILKKLLFYMNRADIRKNYLSPSEINRLGGNGKLTLTAINKLQIALQTYRQVVDEIDHARQRVMRADLQQRGYNEHFSFVDDIGIRNILGVQKEFTFRIQEDFVNFPQNLNENILDAAVLGPDGLANVEVYDFPNKEGILHKTDNTSDTREHYLKDKTRQQIYRLHEIYTDENGNKFMYGVFGTVKPQPLPKIVSPQMDGYIPTMHAEGWVGRRIKTKFRLNGKDYDFSKNPEAALKFAQPFSEAVFMFKSEQQAIDTAQLEQQNYIDKDGNYEYVYFHQMAAEIDGNGVQNDNEIRRYQLRSNKQKTHIEYELDSDPYSSLIENVKATNQQYLDVVGIGQLKAEFMRAVENNPNISISDPDLSLGIGRLEDNFPTVNQIKPVAGDTKTHSHFLRLHNKITLLEHGRQRGVVAGIAISMADYLDWTSKMMYTKEEGAQRNFSLATSQAATDIRRNAGAVVGSVMKPVTTFWILLRPIKQLLLQSMASLGPITVVSRGNPFIMARIYANAIKLIATRMSNQKMMREGRGDIQKAIDNMYNEKDLAAMGEVPSDHDGSYNYSRKELEFIDQWERKSGLSNVQDHVYNHGIGWSNVPELGSLDKSNLNPLSRQGLQNISQGGAGLLNPMMYIGKTSAFASKYGFEFGESINRDLFAIVALEDFRNKNPKANWKSDANMSKIMIEANKLAGGMNNTMAFGWQGNFGMRVFGLFTSFSQKMSTRYFDDQATPFTAKERAGLMAADFAIYGTLILSLEELVRNQFLEDEDEDIRAFGEKMGRLNFVSLMYNYIGEVVTGEESTVEPGKTFGVLGPSPLGPLSTVFKLVAEYIETSTMTPDEHIAALSFYKNLLGNNGAAELLIDTFGGWRHTLTAEQRLRLLGGAFKKMLPVVKQTDKLIMGLIYDEWVSDRTKSGMETGLELTTPEKVGEFLGLPNTITMDFWNRLKKNSLDDKAIKQEAKDFIEKIYLINSQKPMELIELRNYIAVKEFMLDWQYMKIGMKEHRAFKDEVFRLIAMQDSSMVEKFYTSFTEDFSYRSSQFSQSEINEAQVLLQTTSRSYPGRRHTIEKMIESMINHNKAYKKENK